MSNQVETCFRRCRGGTNLKLRTSPSQTCDGQIDHETRQTDKLISSFPMWIPRRFSTIWTRTSHPRPINTITPVPITSTWSVIQSCTVWHQQWQGIEFSLCFWVVKVLKATPQPRQVSITQQICSWFPSEFHSRKLGKVNSSFWSI